MVHEPDSSDMSIKTLNVEDKNREHHSHHSHLHPQYSFEFYTKREQRYCGPIPAIIPFILVLLSCAGLAGYYYWADHRSDQSEELISLSTSDHALLTNVPAWIMIGVQLGLFF